MVEPFLFGYIVFILIIVKSFPFFPTLFCKKKPFDLVSILAISQAINIIGQVISKPIKAKKKSKILFIILSFLFILLYKSS
jgi:hypothetical protein